MMIGLASLIYNARVHVAHTLILVLQDVYVG